MCKLTQMTPLLNSLKSNILTLPTDELIIFLQSICHKETQKVPFTFTFITFIGLSLLCFLNCLMLCKLEIKSHCERENGKTLLKQGSSTIERMCRLCEARLLAPTWQKRNTSILYKETYKYKTLFQYWSTYMRGYVIKPTSSHLVTYQSMQD